MTFEEAKTRLVDNAIGDNEYHIPTTWQEPREAAEQEICFAEDRISEFSNLASIANDNIDPF
ncbi:hypothetical protein AGJ34_20805 [Cronobacter dublinensis subsp. dublinensis]|nr:hypothetical protein [Cronobacter dublinensis subsp. dublinensis]EGT5729716.1 hypothetical protein [Cronobacter dublinensis subsp. dublinensis]